MRQTLIVEKLNSQQIVPTHIDMYEANMYVYVNNQYFKDIFGASYNNISDAALLEGLVKIQCNGKPIYRRLIGKNIDKKTIMMAYRSQCELKVKEGASYDFVIEPATWFCYLWNNQDSCIKYPFQFAFWGIVIAFASFLLSIIGIAVSLLSMAVSIISCCHGNVIVM